VILNKKITVCLLACFMFVSATAYDVLLEVKGAAFVPTSQPFRDIYGDIGQFGLELTAGSLLTHLYAFSSIDFLIKNGETIGLASPTKVNMIDLAVGVKYFVPFNHGDFYVGVGVQPTYLSITNQGQGPIEPAQWNCGGVAKVGAIFNMPHSFFADIFFDYSFAKFNASTVPSSPVTTTNTNGCVFGIGFGYRFN